MKSLYKKFEFTLITAFTAIVIFTLPQIVRAAGVTDYILSPIISGATDIINWILSLFVNFIGTIIIGVAASLVNYVFQFQSFLKVPVVQIGWTMSRDMANMGFILIMLAMAFGTILRFDSYGWKKLLPKLIIVALLINFSLVIAGVFIDIGNSVGLFFVSGGNGDQVNVGDNIMTAMRSGAIAQLRNEVSTAGDGLTKIIFGSIVQLLFYLIIAFLLLSLAFIMIFRMVNLWLLLIMAPFAWISYALPGLGGYWSKWWGLFFKWSFFPAVMGFFIFLGLLTGASFQGSPMTGPDVGGVWGWLFPESLFSNVMQFIVVVVILFTGLSQSSKLTGVGASSMNKAIGDVQKWGVDKLKSTALNPIRRAGGSLTQRALYEKDEKTGQRTNLRQGLVSGMQKLSGIPLVGGAAGGAIKIPMSIITQRKKLTEREEEKLKKNSSDMLRMTFSSLNKDQKAAALRILADRGDIQTLDRKEALRRKYGAAKYDDLTKDQKDDKLDKPEDKIYRDLIGQINESKNGTITQTSFNESLKHAASLGLDKEILTAAPQFAAIVGKTIKDIINKMSPGKADKLQAGSLENSEVLAAILEAIKTKNWDSGHIKKISSEKPKVAADLLDYLRDNLTDVDLAKLPKSTKNYIRTGGAFTDDDEDEDAGGGRNRIVAGTEENFQEAIRQRDNGNQNQGNNQNNQGGNPRIIT